MSTTIQVGQFEIGDRVVLKNPQVPHYAGTGEVFGKVDQPCAVCGETEVVAVSERCPMCGANASDHVALANPGVVTPCEWACGTYRVLATGEIVESEACLRNQLARARERIAELESIVELDQRQNERRLDAIKSVLERVGDPKYLRYFDEQSVYMLWEFCRIWESLEEWESCRMWELLKESLERGDGGD